MSVLSDIVCGHQLSTAYHALHLCYLVCVTAHASLVHVYGIALYLWFTFPMASIPGCGAGSSSKAHSRERSVVNPSSQMHVVTLSQPATDSQLLALASTWPTLASNEALLTVELPQAVRPDRSTHRFTIQPNAAIAAPKSRGQR